MNKVIMGVDVGTMWGAAISNEEYIEGKSTGAYDFYCKMLEFVDLYKPQVIVTAYPTAGYNIISSLSRKIGALEVVCGKRGIQLEKTNDSHAQKVVLGHKRKPTKKRTQEEWDEVKDRYGVGSEHVGDALMFRECYLIEKELTAK